MVSSALPAPGVAATLSVQPSISLEGSWDSNIFDVSADETSDYIFRAKPAVTFFLEAFHTTAKITGGFEFEKYAENDQLDDSTATSNFDLTVAEPFRITPNFSLKPSATYVETRDSVRRTELTQDPTQELPPSDSVVTTRTKQRTYRAFLQAMFVVTPKVDFSLGGGGSKREFVETVPEADEEDSQTITGDASLSYRFSARFSGGLFFTANRYSFDESPESRSYAGGLMARYLLSPNHTLAWRIGASYFEEDADAAGGTTEDWSPYGRLSLTYVWQQFHATLGGSYQVSGAGTFGQATNRGNVDLTLTDQFAERWSWDLSGSYQINRSIDDQDQDPVDVTTIHTSAGVRYRAAEWLSFRLSGNVVRQSSDGTQGDDVDGESVVLGVVVSKLYRYSKLY